MAKAVAMVLVKFKDSGRIFNHLAKVNEVKIFVPKRGADDDEGELADFTPVSCFDFSSSSQYRVKWQKSDISNDGFYPATILGMAATYEEMVSKIKKNKWKEPLNSLAFKEVASQTPENENSTEPPQQKEAAAGRRRSSRKFPQLELSVRRMEGVLNDSNISSPKPASSVAPSQVRDESPCGSKMSLHPKPQTNSEGHGVEDSIDTTLPVESSSIEGDFSGDEDDEDDAAKYFDLEKKYQALRKELRELKDLHSTCTATIRFSDKLRAEQRTEIEQLKAAFKSLQENCNIKVKEIAMKNVKLQLELGALKKSSAGSGWTRSETLVRTSPAVSTSKCSKTLHRSSPIGSGSKHSETVLERATSPNLFSDDMDTQDFGSDHNNSDTGNKFSVSDVSSLEASKDDSLEINEKDCNGSDTESLNDGLPGKKVKANKSAQKQIAAKVCNVLNKSDKFHARNGKIHVGYGLWISQEYWDEKLATADSDNQFVNRFPVSLWGSVELGKRTLETKRPGKSVATPEKTSIVFGAFSGRLDHMGVQDEAKRLRLTSAKSALSRKFTEYSRPPRKKREGKKADNAEQQ